MDTILLGAVWVGQEDYGCIFRVVAIVVAVVDEKYFSTGVGAVEIALRADILQTSAYRGEGRLCI